MPHRISFIICVGIHLRQRVQRYLQSAWLLLGSWVSNWVVDILLSNLKSSATSRPSRWAAKAVFRPYTCLWSYWHVPEPEHIPILLVVVYAIIFVQMIGYNVRVRCSLIRCKSCVIDLLYVIQRGERLINFIQLGWRVWNIVQVGGDQIGVVLGTFSFFPSAM